MYDFTEPVSSQMARLRGLHRLCLASQTEECLSHRVPGGRVPRESFKISSKQFRRLCVVAPAQFDGSKRVVYAGQVGL